MLEVNRSFMVAPASTYEFRFAAGLRLVREQFAKSRLGFFLAVFQAELQIKPTLGQFGPMPGPAALNDVQSDLFLPERGGTVPNVPGKDAKRGGNWFRLAVLGS